MEEELPSGENLPSHFRISFCGALPTVFTGSSDSSPDYSERCSVSLPAFPLTFSEFLGWAIPKAIGNLLSDIYLTEATGSVTQLSDSRV